MAEWTETYVIPRQTRWLGTWELEQPYEVGDGVFYNGNSWVAIQDNVGQAPPTDVDADDFWHIVAGGGPEGIEGPQGAQGIAGPKGDKGDRGPIGPQGTQGPKGDKGDTGNTGSTGPAGATGAAGAEGPVGPTGPPGLDGQTGPQGPIGLTGPEGPEGPEGPQGPPGEDGGGGGVTDHGDLDGLTDDDHIQYYNAARHTLAVHTGLGLVPQTALDDHLNDTTDAHDASAISYAGGTGISSTNVEAAIDELATEKADAHSHPYASDSHAHSANDLTDVDTSGSDSGEFMRFNGTLWVPAALTDADIPSTIARDSELPDLAGHLADASDAHDASAISFSPTGSIASTDVQAAIAEAASEGGGGGGSGITPYVKSGNQSWTSDTTLANVTDLVHAMLANEKFIFEILLFVSGGTTGDIKLSLTWPAGAAGKWGVDGQGTAAGGIESGSRFDTQTTSGGTAALGTLAATNTVRLFGTIRNGANAGDLQLQAAQNTSNGTATVIQADSWLKVEAF